MRCAAVGMSIMTLVKRKRRANAGHRAELEVGEMWLWRILGQKHWEEGHLFQHRRRIMKEH